MIILNKIMINHKCIKNETIYASLKVENVLFSADELEDYIYKYVLSKENIKYIFCDDNPSHRKYANMYKRFLPPDDCTDIPAYVDKMMKENNHKNFYSFFAEALLPLAYRDVYGYELEEAAIDITQTLIDTNSGVDGCLYDKKNNIFILGEAKFYKDFAEGLNQIIIDFTKNGSFINKLDSLYRKMRNNTEMDCIILKQLGKNIIDEYSLKEFLNLKIGFSGFVLHEVSSIDISNINDDSFYDKYLINVSDLKSNIIKNYQDLEKYNYKISMFHFFVKSKRDLIIKIINYAKYVMEGVLKNGENF